MRFGASSWPFQWDPPYEDCIRRVASLGFKSIELIGWNLDYLTNYYTPSKVKELRACLADEGLKLSQFVSTPHDLSSADAGKRAAAVEHWKRAVDVGTEARRRAHQHGVVPRFRHEGFGRDPRITTKPLVQELRPATCRATSTGTRTMTTTSKR